MAPRIKKYPEINENLDPSHPFIGLVPPMAKFTDYRGRKVGGVKDVDVLDSAMRLGYNVGIFGPTGSAKTSLVMAYAALHRYPVYNVPCNGAVDPAFLFGSPKRDHQGHYVMAPGIIYYLARYGGVINLDEVTFMPPKMGAMLHSPMDSRRQMVLPDYIPYVGQPDALGNPIESTFTLHDYTMITGTWNPGYSGTYQMNKAFFNRFGIKMAFGYLRTVEEEMINSSSLLDFATAVRSQVDSGLISTPMSTNMLIEFEQFAFDETLGVGFAVENLLNAFDSAERPAIAETMRRFSAAIAKELNAILAEDEEDYGATEEEVDEEFEEGA